MTKLVDVRWGGPALDQHPIKSRQHYGELGMGGHIKTDIIMLSSVG